MSIILLLAAQAAGQEITTFYPLPSQQKAEQAQQAQPPAQKASQPVEAEAKPEDQAKPTPPKPPEKIEVLSVRKVAPNANVVFVPPPPEAPKD